MNTLVASLILFAGTVVLAVYQGWSSIDLLWSLWISSLTLGYFFILTSIVGACSRGDLTYFLGGEDYSVDAQTVDAQIAVIRKNAFCIVILFIVFRWSFPTKLMILITIPSFVLCIGEILRIVRGWGFFPRINSLPIRILILLPQAFLILGFFTVHFLFFHFIHSTILNQMFPLINESYFGKTMEGTASLFKNIVVKALHNYWPFILASALSRIESYRNAFKKSLSDSMVYPYINVLRMHLMIVIIGLMVLIYPVKYVSYALLIFYFFPFGSMVKRKQDTLSLSG